MQRIKRKRAGDNFTILSNDFLRDEKLSLKAKGLLAYILSLPDDWKIYFEEVEKHHSDGVRGVRSAWKNLEEQGYARTVKVKEKGRIKEWAKEVADFKFPDSGFVHVENVDVEILHVENSPLLNTNKQSTDKPTTNSTKDNNADNNADKSAEFDLEKRFEALWKLYPRKAGNKQKAKAAYKKAVKSGVDDKTIKQGILNLIAEKRETRFIPHGQTWFCNERWNDEPLVSENIEQRREAYTDLDLPF